MGKHAGFLFRNIPEAYLSLASYYCLKAQTHNVLRCEQMAQNKGQ